MNMPLVLLNRRRRGFTAFSPSTLYSSGSQGIWLDPSDVANLTWRRNLLTYSESFDNAAWTRIQVLAVGVNAAVAPDGTTTADRLTPNTANDARYVAGAPTISPGFPASMTHSVYVKPDGYGKVAFRENATSGAYASFDAINGTVLATGNAGAVTVSTPTITNVGNGWYRISAVFTASASITQGFSVWLLSPSYTTGAPPALPWVGNGTDGVLIWGAQLELGTSATDYQRISDVNTEVIERFPTATMFSDRAGTTAVTTPGTVVGLRLDKSKGLVLGAELVTNGTFDNGTTGWLFEAGWAIASGVATGTATGGFLYQNTGSITQSKYYDFTFTVTGYAGGSIQPFVGSSPIFGAAASSNGTFTRRIFLSGSSGQLGLKGTSFTGTIDNISVRELAGNHAVAPTDAARPIYGVEPKGGRRNLLTYSEQFDNAAWAKDSCTVVSNTTLAPDGTTTADRIVSAAATVQIGVGQGLPTTPTAVAHTASYYVQANGARYVQLLWSTPLSTNYANFDLQNPTAPTAGTYTGATITPAANGFYRITITSTLAAAAGGTFLWFVDSGTAARAAAYTGNGTSGAFIWGAQLELGSTATPYQRVTTAYDVTESGVQTCHYVQYDGSDDGMITNSIDFTATDKMSVFAGVRKLSDAAAGIVVELGSTGTPTGGLRIGANTSAGDASRRTWFMGQDVFGVEINAGAGIYPSPDTRIQTGLFDRAAETSQTELEMRLNGTAQTLTYSNTALVTGNFGNHRLNIGRRGNDQTTPTAPFFGRDYGIIVVGKAASAGEITDTETWLAAKTSGVTL